jgi:hypothetical protein
MSFDDNDENIAKKYYISNQTKLFTVQWSSHTNYTGQVEELVSHNRQESKLRVGSLHYLSHIRSVEIMLPKKKKTN